MTLLDVIVPTCCPACGAVSGGAALCPTCAAASDGLRLPPTHATVLAARVVAVGVFAYDGVVRDAVRGMKIGGCHWAARPLGELVRARAGVPAGWPVTWVPSTARRRRQRGVDIAALLAGRDAVRLLRRTTERPDQTGLSAVERRRSPVGVFRPAANVPPNVVLVDDVLTTGATALAAAGALLDGGARAVVVATLAVGGDGARGGATGER